MRQRDILDRETQKHSAVNQQLEAVINELDQRIINGKFWLQVLGD